MGNNEKSTTNPLVSVIVASYNHERYIEKCINSLFKQTYKNIEILVIDDCSSDSTWEKLNKFNDSRLSIQRNKNNLGTVSTINKLIEKSKGEYIAFIGSDDYWKEDKLSKQVDILESNKKYGACFSNALFVDDNNCVIQEQIPDDIDINVFKHKNGSQQDLLRELFEKLNFLCHPSCLIRKSVINDIGLFSERYMQLHDMEYWIRLLYKYNIYIMEEATVYYRRSKKNESVSSPTLEKHNRHHNELCLILIDFVNNMPDDLFFDVFKDLLVKTNNHSRDEITCEKYFILKSIDNLPTQSLLSAFIYFNSQIKNENFLKTLSSEFDYTIIDYYHDYGLYLSPSPIDLNNQYIDLTSQYSKLLGEHNQLLNENKYLKDQLSQYDISLREAIDSIELLKSSTSWKLTKPLRKIKSVLQK